MYLLIISNTKNCLTRAGHAQRGRGVVVQHAHARVRGVPRARIGPIIHVVDTAMDLRTFKASGVPLGSVT